MSYLNLKNSHIQQRVNSKKSGSMRKAFSTWLIKNYGQDYISTLKKQNTLTPLKAVNKNQPKPVVGIVGGGFAGMYAGLLLQSLGYEFKIFESSDRVGGRIKTWYSKNYNANKVNQAGLYGEVGGMRLPQFAPDMLPVQHLALCVNSVLQRIGQLNKQVKWRKFYYNSPVQRLRFNNMDAPIISKNAGNSSLHFNVSNKGDVPDAWFKTYQTKDGKSFVPANVIMDCVNAPFIAAINKNFENGFTLLMKFDRYSMWDYLANVFKLKDLKEYYVADLGKPNDLLPWSVVSFLETTNVGTGMFSVSFVEMVLAAYDWGGSKDPYRPSEPNVYMLTAEGGMQQLPNACLQVLNTTDAVNTYDGYTAQVQLGMLAGADGKKSYNPPNLTKDAIPPPPEITVRDKHKSTPPPQEKIKKSSSKQRVFLKHKVVELKYNSTQSHMDMKYLNSKGKLQKETFPFVISTLPFGQYLSGYPQSNLLNDISFQKAQAIRECHYMPSFKAFITFKKQFWIELGQRQGYAKDQGLGAASTDRANRQIIYPSYGYDAQQGVLQIYCWAEDAQRLGALSDEERVNECLKGIAYLYPDGNVYENFAGYKPEVTTKTWYWDSHAGGGAFALFNPSQFKNIYPTLLTPEFDGHLNFAGEACSVHHGWIVGALDSAYNAVYNILTRLNDRAGIAKMESTWGTLSKPDIAE
jgi:monoamine oxidase